jgi:hypothetical protein
MKIVVYSSIMVKDVILDKPIDKPGDFYLIPGIDYVLLTNLPNGKEVFKKSGWAKGEIRIMEPPEEEMPNRNKKGWAIYAARWCKWHPDRLFSDYDLAIWIDGWQIPDYNKKEELLTLCNELLNQNKVDILLEEHNKNKCIYDEHQSIIFCQKDSYENMFKVSKYVKVMGCPMNVGVFWTGCMIYKIGSKKIQDIVKYLWIDMCLYTYRDQALLTFEIWRTNGFDNWGKVNLSNLVIATYTDKNHIYI